MKSFSILSIISFMVITFYCAKDPPLTSSKVPIEQLNTLGWAEFSAGNYNGSLTYFNKVLSEYSDNVSANVGKGWLLLMQNHDDLSAIANHLQKGVLDDNWKADARCGLAVTKLIQKQYSYIEVLVDLILNDYPDYFFQYKPSIDWHDLLVVKAQAYFMTKKYDLAWETIQQLTSDYALNPEDPKSWVVNETVYFSFEAALSKIIEILTNTYRE